RHESGRVRQEVTNEDVFAPVPVAGHQVGGIGVEGHAAPVARDLGHLAERSGGFSGGGCRYQHGAFGSDVVGVHLARDRAAVVDHVRDDSPVGRDARVDGIADGTGRVVGDATRQPSRSVTDEDVPLGVRVVGDEVAGLGGEHNQSAVGRQASHVVPPLGLRAGGRYGNHLDGYRLPARHEDV